MSDGNKPILETAGGALIFLGMAAGSFGAFLLFFFISDNAQAREAMPIIALILGGVMAVCFVDIIFRVVLQGYFRRRRAALRALGKHGLRSMYKDRTARLAYKGIYKLMQDKYPEAEELLTKALSLADVRNNQIFCVEWLGHVYEAMENDARLLWCYRKAVEFAPENPEFQSRLGHAYFVDGRLEKSKYCFEQALHFDPNHGYSRYSLAKICMVRGEDGEAVRRLEELAKIQENHPLIFAELAVIHAMNGREEQCKECYEKAVLCGYERPEQLSRRMTAIFEFNRAEGADASDLPSEYYSYQRRTVKEDKDAGNE